MCGITGLISSRYSTEQLKRLIELSCAAIRHRGPDDEKYFMGKDVALGVTRLAIRDPENGSQPMQKNGLVIVFNGELYATESLKERLLALGYQFETTSDTEILLHGFHTFGPSIFSELVGMFACAIWDIKQKVLTLARDRFGEKPLYYTELGDSFAFASEIKAFYSWPHIEWEIDQGDLLTFLKSSYLPCPKTGWKNIYKLKPGCYLKVKEQTIERHQYFSKSFSLKTETMQPKDLHLLLDQSVENCLVSDKKIGAFLSGGLDSSTIAYFLAKHLPHSPLFSLHWDESDYSEKKYSEIVAKALGGTHHLVKCDSNFFLSHFDKIVSLYDEPFADESMFATYCLAQFAKQFVDVVLTGDGADEFFHGYERYFYQGDLPSYLDVFAASPQQTLELFCKKDFLQLEIENPFLKHIVNVRKYASDDRIRSLLDIDTYLPDDILMKVDRACMGVGLEARAPFLTPTVTDFALNCSLEQLITSEGQGKQILRKAMEKFLPRPILERKKMGFGMPIKDWLNSTLEDFVGNRLFEGVLLSTGWFTKAGIQNLLSIHKSGKKNYSRTILNLLVLETWLKSSSNGLQLLHIASHQSSVMSDNVLNLPIPPPNLE